MKPIRVILVAVALGALVVVPGALATTTGLFTANDPTLGPVAVGSTDTATVTITNSDTAAHTINSLSLSGANPGQFSLSNDNCSGTTLDPGSDEHLHRHGHVRPDASPGRRPPSWTSPTTAAVTRPTSPISVERHRGPASRSSASTT